MVDTVVEKFHARVFLKLCIQALGFPSYTMSIRAILSLTYNSNTVVQDSS